MTKIHISSINWHTKPVTITNNTKTKYGTPTWEAMQRKLKSQLG